jgi:hypothetical protein
MSISGARYDTVPQNEFVPELFSVTPAFASPKSISLACPLPSITILSGLRSR